ncbi:Interferon-induced very large GTPase 1 [Holothuria leucospilota]|uniref:Interferon-induced very large GTPase 1 n=1 Tax=Holothuria leucospilota TaxID=206669 RepID=A0A9Q1HLV4_HOLLE|nr:Interferon-induced very large GTPase 1 [Holothuria leucospilota]
MLTSVYLTVRQEMATGNPDRSESQEYGGAEQSLLILLDRLGLSEETKLTMMDGRIFNTNSEKGELLQTDVVTYFFQDLSAKDQNALANLRENYKKLGNGDIVSSRDLIFAILTCCDQFLLQQVLCKLVKCNSAVPVLMPDGKNENITFLLWGLRQCNGVLYDTKTKNYEDISFTKYPVMTISAIRFGKVDLSKSDILNSLLKSLHGFDVSERFLSNRVDPGTRVCSLGTVEYVPYLAKCKSSTSLPMSFLNLRGDASKYEKQLKFCCKNSQIVIVFSEIRLIKAVQSPLRKLNPSSHIIFLSPNDENDVDSKGDRISIVTLKNPVKIVSSIKELILEVNGATKFSLQPLDEMKLSCKDLCILTDEECEICLKARSAALDLSAAINKPQHAEKSKLYPLQDIWNESIVSRERIGKGNDEPRQEQKQGDELKLRQGEAPVSDEMLKFMAIVFDSDKELVNYFITWLQIFLKERSNKVFKSIIGKLKENVKERRIVYGQLGFLKSSTTGDWPKHRKDFQQNRSKNEKETINQKDYDEYQNFDSKIIEQEDFLREIGQMFECNRSIQLVKEKPISPSEMAEIAVDLLVNGHCIELFQNKTSCVAVSWLKAICERLHTSLENKPTVRVVSIIGGPSSGKSHLLNCTFGTNFSEGEGRCSRGVRLAVVPLHSNIQKLAKCNFLIIADTESVNVSETTVAESKKKNNYISTLVACISDVVIIKIGKEDTPQEVTGTFTIALRGLQRGRNVGEALQACIVQSFDNTKLQLKQKDVLEELERITQKLAKNGQVSTSGNELSQKKVNEDLLQCFSRGADETKKVKNIQFLFTPDSHCLLKDNNRYSSDVKKFRATVIQMLTECNKIPRFFTEFGEHAQDVIQSMDSDNFIEAYQAVTFRKRCDAFLTQCEQTLSTISSKLSGRTVQVSNDMISAVNNGKSIDDVKNLEEEVLKELSELTIRDIHNLLRKIESESKRHYFQPFLNDIQTIKTKVELFRATQMENINTNVKETITNITQYGRSVEEFSKKLSDTMADLDETFIQSCDHLCTAEYSEIDSLVKHVTKELTKQLNEKLVTLNDELEAIKRNEFKAHFESVKANFDLISSTYRTKVLDVLKARADEVSKVFTYVSQHEKDLYDIQIELSENLSIMLSKLNEEGKTLDEILNQIIREIETLANEKFNKIQTKMEDRINTKLFPHIHKRLTDECCLAHETSVQEAREQLKISADLIKEKRALQVLTKTLEMKKKQEKREKYVLQFNAVLSKIQQDLEAKLLSFCRSIMRAKFDTIDEICQSKDKEFREIATERFNTLLQSTSKEKGNSFEIKEYKSFEHSSKSVEERILSKMKKQFKETVSKAKKKKQRNEKVLHETKHFIETMKEGLQNQKDNSKACKKKKFESKFKPFLSKVKENNPLPPIFRLKKDKETELLSEVRKRGIISDTISDDLSAYTSTCNNVQSKDDVAKISKDFSSVDERNEKDFNNLATSLFELSEDFVNFEQNVYKLVKMIKQFEHSRHALEGGIKASDKEGQSAWKIQEGKKKGIR